MAHTQQRLARILRAEARRYLQRLRAARRDASIASVHALRTATRRLLAALSLSGAVRPQDRDRSIDAALEGPFRACGRVRDLQLMRRVVGSRCTRHPELAALELHLCALLAKEQRRLARRLMRAHPKRLERALGKLAARMERMPPAAPRSADARQRLLGALGRSERSMVARRHAATATDAKSLHRARLAFKAHRYQLELAAPLLAPRSDARVRRLRRFQAALGEITDRSTLLRTIDDFLDTHPRSAADVQVFRQRIERERRALIRRYLPAIAVPRRARSKASSR